MSQIRFIFAFLNFDLSYLVSECRSTDLAFELYVCRGSFSTGVQYLNGSLFVGVGLFLGEHLYYSQ